jgi:hypothetical protein
MVKEKGEEGLNIFNYFSVIKTCLKIPTTNVFPHDAEED